MFKCFFQVNIFEYDLIFISIHLPNHWALAVNMEAHFDTYNLCTYHKEGKLQAFNVAMLKTILRHFEVPFRAKDRKTDLIRLLTEVIQECNC